PGRPSLARRLVAAHTHIRTITGAAVGRQVAGFFPFLAFDSEPRPPPVKSGAWGAGGPAHDSGPRSCVACLAPDSCLSRRFPDWTSGVPSRLRSTSCQEGQENVQGE